jgi:hypothetical protein
LVSARIPDISKPKGFPEINFISMHEQQGERHGAHADSLQHFFGTIDLSSFDASGICFQASIPDRAY